MRWALRLWPALPVASLIAGSHQDGFLHRADAVLGYDALICLVACLLVTPVVIATRLPVSRLRLWYGEWVFALAALLLFLHSLIEGPVHGSAGSLVRWTGTLALAVLIPMAVTSTDCSRRVLGPHWKRWQRPLMWAVWGIVAVHLTLVHEYLALGAYEAATLPGILVRTRFRPHARAWRKGGYRVSRLGLLVLALGLVTLAGLGFLGFEEVQAIASQVTT